MAEPGIRGLPAALDGPVARLAGRREQLAKAWLLELVERTPLAEIEQLPTDRLIRGLPDLIGGVLSALAPDDRSALEPGGAAHTGALGLAGIRGEQGGRALPADLASLQSVLLSGLRAELGDQHPEAFLDAVERLCAVIGALQVIELEEVLGASGTVGEWKPPRDDLTGLPDVRFLQERAGELAALQRRYAHPFALLLIDIDGLGRINAAHGDSAGDAALRALAGALKETVRESDIAARTGGDEFCVLAPQQTATRAVALATRIAAAAGALEPGDRIAMRVAIGIAGFPEHTSQHEELFVLADAAMFRARAAGEAWALAAAVGSRQ